MAKKKKNKNKQYKITIEDYVKAVKKADREIALTNQAGWKATSKIHKSKKIYSRKKNKKNYLDI